MHVNRKDTYKLIKINKKMNLMKKFNVCIINKKDKMLAFSVHINDDHDHVSG